MSIIEFKILSSSIVELLLFNLSGINLFTNDNKIFDLLLYNIKNNNIISKKKITINIKI